MRFEIFDQIAGKIPILTLKISAANILNIDFHKFVFLEKLMENGSFAIIYNIKNSFMQLIKFII